MAVSRRLILLLFLSATLAVGQRDVYRDVARIVAVGDVHGDADALESVLQSAAVIDGQKNWSGGKTHLVLLGDLPDRGPDTRRIAEWLIGLEKSARRAGGAVHVLVGNHDAMMVYGDLRYVTPAEYAAFADGKSAERREDLLRLAMERDHPADAAAYRQKFEAATPLGFVEHRKAWEPGGVLGRWVGARAAILHINDTLFIHAGISPRVLESFSFEQINRQIRAELTDISKVPNGLATAEDGPLWFRGLASDQGPEAEAHAAAVCAKFGVARIVIGHTPTKQPIVSRLGGRVINVDVGLSRAYGGPRDALVYEDGVWFTLPAGQKTPLR